MRRIFTCLLLVVLGTKMAWAAMIKDEPRRFSPYSKTAIAITGPVTLSTTRISFQNGTGLGLYETSSESPGSWGNSGNIPFAQVFRVSGKVGALRQGNTLCGDQSVTYLSATKEESSDFEYLVVALFAGTDIPSGINDPSLCGIFSYAIEDARQ